MVAVAQRAAPVDFVSYWSVMDAGSLRDLLVKETLPWAWFPVPGQGDDERAIEVRDLRRALKARELELERGELDGLIEQLGGRREAMIDPWSMPRRAVDWLRGRGWRSNDLYLLPSSMFEPTSSPEPR